VRTCGHDDHRDEEDCGHDEMGYDCGEVHAHCADDLAEGFCFYSGCDFYSCFCFYSCSY
jgi:hypothetical protein